METQEGDDEAAVEEDTAMEDAAAEKEGLDLAEHQAQVQFEEEQLLEAGDDLEDTFNVSTALQAHLELQWRRKTRGWKKLKSRGGRIRTTCHKVPIDQHPSCLRKNERGRATQVHD